MNDVALLRPEERAEIFQETAARKSISSVVAMEKDFWVCWVLVLVFHPPLVDGMVFKGGTSLSKVYYAINRFSEDIDLSLPREAFGFTGTHDIKPGISRSQRDILLTEMRDACEAHVSGSLLGELSRRIAAILGAPESEAWSVEIAAGDAGTLLFAYPPALSAEAYGAGGYIRPIIRLEFGGRNEVWPAETHTIRPYCIEVFPELSSSPSCDVTVLAAERTFWEKSTLIHAEFHRPATSVRPERVSRHYSDLARLSRQDIGVSALARPDLLRAVAHHKAAYFPLRWARYDETMTGRLHLVPHEALETELRADYAAMREMFFDDPESFEDMMTALKELESRINERAADETTTQ
jgi:hypothetical protein